MDPGRWRARYLGVWKDGIGILRGANQFWVTCYKNCCGKWLYTVANQSSTMGVVFKCWGQNWTYGVNTKFLGSDTNFKCEKYRLNYNFPLMLHIDHIKISPDPTTCASTQPCLRYHDVAPSLEPQCTVWAHYCLADPHDLHPGLMVITHYFCSAL